MTTPIKPPKQYPYPVNPANWYIFQRTLQACAVKPVAGGIKFEFNVSAQPDPNSPGPWIDYLTHEISANSPLFPPTKAKPREPIQGTRIVYRFQVIATPGTRFNFVSDPNNATGPTPATVRPMIRMGMASDGGEFERWWCDTQSYQMQNSNGIVTLDCPLDPAQWSSVYGKKGTDSPEALAGFKATLAAPTFVGMTFGGGFFYGHGNNVSCGKAEFHLLDVYSY